MIKNDKLIKEDTNGRIHSLDQSQRSLEKRLRAVERRLSTGDALNGKIFPPEPELDPEDMEQIKEQIAEIRIENEEFKASIASVNALSIELQDVKNNNLKLLQEIEKLENENMEIRHTFEQSRSENVNDVSIEIKNELNQLNLRLERTEKRDRINIGSVKVPVELSGIVGAVILILTGILITQSRWDIIRSAYFSFGISIVFAAAVLIKFYVANRSVK